VKVKKKGAIVLGAWQEKMTSTFGKICPTQGTPRDIPGISIHRSSWRTVSFVQCSAKKTGHYIILT
jgi:hypothetical protein